MTGCHNPAFSIHGPVYASPPNTQGGSPVRESRPPGSVRGASSDGGPYRDTAARGSGTHSASSQKSRGRSTSDTLILRRLSRRQFGAHGCRRQRRLDQCQKRSFLRLLMICEDVAVPVRLLTFERTEIGVLNIHLDEAGATELIKVLQRLLLATENAHDHLMTSGWGGTELTDEIQNGRRHADRAGEYPPLEGLTLAGSESSA
jgi:hypothetical protein